MAPTPVLLPGESHGQRSLGGGGVQFMGSQSWTRLSDFSFTSMGHSEGSSGGSQGKSKEAKQDPCAHWPLLLTHYWPHTPQGQSLVLHLQSLTCGEWTAGLAGIGASAP